MRVGRCCVGALLLWATAACGDAPYIELQIADDRLPFLEAGADFDGLGVEAGLEGCADAQVRYPGQPLPATLTIQPGDCFAEQVRLRASAYLGNERIAESVWLELEFPEEGALVVTATLSAASS